MVTPGPNARDVDPVAHVMVKADAGTLTDVRMVNEGGKTVAGRHDPGQHRLEAHRSPGLRAHLHADGHQPRARMALRPTQVSSFSTLRPSNQTKVSFTTTSEAALQDGGTYGVGTVVVAHFDEQIADRAAAERQLKVTTNPAVQGSWFWVDGQNAHWRPEHYYAPGTTVTAEAKIYGIALGRRLIRARRQPGVVPDRRRARIHRRRCHQTWSASSTTELWSAPCPPRWEWAAPKPSARRRISLWTPPGIYTVLDKGNPVVMDSSTFGLPKNSRLGYRETINYATRISTDGIYLHQLDATVWAQGHTDTSHGCLNLNADNAKWFYDFSVPGDVVEVRNSGGPPLKLAQNGDWTLSWDQWRKGSALKPTS